MTQAYTFLEDRVISDLAFEATGDTPAELFQAAGQALFAGMADTRRLHPRVRKEIRLRNANLDQLLYDWLSELIYLKDVTGLLFVEFSVQIDSAADPKPSSIPAAPPAAEGAAEAIPQAPRDTIWNLVSSVRGEAIDAKRHALRADVKAVTYHQFEVVQTETGGWKAHVVVDI